MDEFPYTLPIQTRWADNDMFGHINNVQYYRFFEILVTEFLLKVARLDVFQGPVLCFAAESTCKFLKPLSWPETLTAGLRLDHIGNTSVRYGMALFGEGQVEPAATGQWVHVFVDRATQRPVPIPAALRAVFEAHRG